MSKANLTVAACATLLWAGMALATASPEEKCQKARTQAQGKYQICVEHVLEKIYGIVSADFNKLFWKCRHKYFGQWTKFQARASLQASSCINTRFTDNGATVTDNLTGLVWEKKTDDSTVHDKDDTYTLTTGPPFKGDGTAFDTFFTGAVTGLNVAGFDGSKDWRLPTLAELQTILQDYPCTGPGGGATCICTGPCIEASFNNSNTLSLGYWSNTSFAGQPGGAWYVDFNAGGVGADSKASPAAVRAVRGSL